MNNAHRLSIEISIVERHLEWLHSLAPGYTPEKRPTVIGGNITAAQLEKSHVLAVLDRVGNVTSTSEITGISRRQLHRKLRDWGIENPRSKHHP